MGAHELAAIYTRTLPVLRQTSLIRRVFTFLILTCLPAAAVSAGEEQDSKTPLPCYYYGGTWHGDAPKTADPAAEYYRDNDIWIRFPKGHIHRPGNGYMRKDSQWEVDRNIRVGKHQTGPYFYDGKWHRRPETGTFDYHSYWWLSSFRDYVARRDHTCDTVERFYELGEDAAARMITLINTGEVERLLGTDDGKNAAYPLIYDRAAARLGIRAPADQILILVTLLSRADAFECFNSARGSDILDCRVFSLIDPAFLDQQSGKATILLALNLDGVARLLNYGTDEYRRSGRRLAFYPDLGTIVVVDTKKHVEQVREYLDGMPYSRVRDAKRILPGR